MSPSNYDLLLDNALLSYDYKPQQPEDQFKAHPVLKVFKPHGSVDWARRVLLPYDETLRPQSIIENAEAIQHQLMNDFRLLSPSEADSNPNRQTFFPVISIPVQNKTDETFAWPHGHLTQLQGLLTSVTRILIIGWQAREAHFIKLLKNSLPKVSRVMAVGGDARDAAKTLERFAESTALVLPGKFDHTAIARGILSVKKDRIYDPIAEGAVELSVAPGGFSDFARNRRVIEFLNA